MVYHLALDDSGTHAQSKLQFLAGTMMSVDEWAGLYPLWVDALDEFGLQYFHATKIWNTRPVDRIQILERFGRIVINRNMVGWWGAVDRAEFKNVGAQFPEIDMNDFELLIYGLIGGCHKSMSLLGEIGKIGVIIEEGHPPVRQEARERIKKYEEAIGLFEHSWQTVPKREMPAQVADCISWNLYKNAKKNGADLPLIKMINEKNNIHRFWGSFFDEGCLLEIYQQLKDNPK